MNGICSTIADELAGQYSIGCSPSNGRPDGRYRRIVVRINSNPDLRLVPARDTAPRVSGLRG